MSAQTQTVATGFTSAPFQESPHVCLIFDSDEQRKKAVAEYLAAGLRRGEQVRYFTDVTSPDEIRSWLLEMGIDLPEPTEDDRFGVFKAESAYCPMNRFEPREMIAGMPHRYEISRKAGYHGVRFCGEMTWALKGIPGSDRILEYEVMLNTVGGTFPHSGMCIYDARHFDGATLFKVLQVHPYMIAQGQIVSNPFYVKPQELLEEPKPS